jgi:hypothetical protein
MMDVVGRHVYDVGCDGRAKFVIGFGQAGKTSDRIAMRWRI